MELSTELEAEIFAHCMDDITPPIPSSDKPPLLFLLVCRHWRDVALSTPVLWNSLHIGVTKGKAFPAPEVLAWMELARNRPFTLSVDFNVYGGARPTETDLEAMNPCFPRCHALILSMRRESMRVCIGHLEASGVLNTVHKLHLRAHHARVSTSMIGVPISTQIVELHLRGVNPTFSSPFYPSLSNLLLSVPLTAAEIMKILSRCPNLERASFRNATNIDGPVRGDVVTLHKLLALHLYTHRISAAWGVLARLRAPSLEDLVVQPALFDFPWNLFLEVSELSTAYAIPINLLEFFQQCRPPLQRLLIPAKEIDVGFLECLQVLPTLRYLGGLQFTRKLEPILVALSKKTNGELDYLPCLQELDIKDVLVHDDGGRQLQLLCDVIGARSDGATRVRTLKLDSCSKSALDKLTSNGTVRSSGVQIECDDILSETSEESDSDDDAY